MHMVELGPFRYYVMTRHVAKEGKDRIIPKVDPKEARILVEMLTLQPDRDEVDAFLQSHGFLAASHLSFHAHMLDTMRRLLQQHRVWL